MQVKMKNLPRLALGDLLRRRKMTLQHFLSESGIQAYASLVIKCQTLGVQPPTEQEYTAISPKTVTSPQDGIVVLEPIPVIDHISGRRIDPEAPVTMPGVEVITDHKEVVDVEPTVGRQKRQKKSKEEPQSN